MVYRRQTSSPAQVLPETVQLHYPESGTDVIEPVIESHLEDIISVGMSLGPVI